MTDSELDDEFSPAKVQLLLMEMARLREHFGPDYRGSHLKTIKRLAGGMGLLRPERR